eukprot:4850749-Pleurochrysis_carterae.AAC.1
MVSGATAYGRRRLARLSAAGIGGRLARAHVSACELRRGGAIGGEAHVRASSCVRLRVRTAEALRIVGTG